MLKIIGPLTQIDSLPQYSVGTRTVTKDGNEYIYLPGVASTAQYDWIVYQTADSAMSFGSITRMTTTTPGPVGIAQAAIVNNKWGWFGIKGVFWGNAGIAIASDSYLYASGTTANVATTVTTTAFITGSVSVQAGASAGTVKVFINYPWLVGSII